MALPCKLMDDAESRLEPRLRQARLEFLQNSRDALRGVEDPIGEKDFTVVFATVVNLGVEQQEIAAYFGLSAAAISRWAAGKATPHPLGRRVAYGKLMELLDKKIEELSKSVHANLQGSVTAGRLGGSEPN